MHDYYDILGVRRDAGADEIQRACRQLIHRYHPDISGDERADADGFVLADEVAIDFPSVATVLDRMRRAFFGEATTGASDDELSIAVAPEEAFWGAAIPLAIPIRRTCTECGGRGEVWGERCGACAGSGHRPVSHEFTLRIPAGVRDGTRVRFSIAAPGLPLTVVDARITIR
jgi:hypothetical protein